MSIRIGNNKLSKMRKYRICDIGIKKFVDHHNKKQSISYIALKNANSICPVSGKRKISRPYKNTRYMILGPRPIMIFSKWIKKREYRTIRCNAFKADSLHKVFNLHEDDPLNTYRGQLIHKRAHKKYGKICCDN